MKTKPSTLPLDRNGIPVLDGGPFDPFLANLFAEQAHGEMVPYDQLAAQLEILKQVIGSLNQEFQVLRDDMARRSYRVKHGSDHTPDELKVQAEEYVQSTRNRVEGRDSYYDRGIPDATFFLKKMLPTIQLLSKTPQELEAVSRTAFEALERILCCEFTSSQFRSRRHVVEGFFNTSDAENSYGIGECPGQFLYFHKKYGAAYALAVAQLQGWLSDKHYDGASYCVSAGIVEYNLQKFWNTCPAEHRDRLMQVYTGYCRMNHYWGDTFVAKFPPVIKAFVDGGHSLLIPFLLDIADLGFRIHCDFGRADGIELFNPKVMLREVQALAQHPFRDEMFAWAKKVMSERGHSRDHISFVKTADVDEKQRDRRSIHSSSGNFADTIDDFQKAGYDDAKIRAILAIDEAHPWLKDLTPDIISSWLVLEKKFPGGAEGMIVYLQKLLPAGDCMRQCLRATTSTTAQIPQDINAPAFAMGIELAQRLGNSAMDFFRDKMFHGDEWRIPQDKQIDFDDPKVMKQERVRMRRIRAASKIAADFPQDPSGYASGRMEVFRWLLSFKREDPKGISRLGPGDPKDLERAIAVFKEAWLEYPEKCRTKKWTPLWEVSSNLRHMMEKFVDVCSAVSHAQKEDTHHRTFPAFEDLARYVRFLILDMNDAYGSLVHIYRELLMEQKDIDPYVAMAVPILEHGIHALSDVDLTRLPLPDELLGDLREGQKIAQFMSETRTVVRKVLENGGLNWMDPFRYLAKSDELAQRSFIGRLVREHDLEGRLARVQQLRKDLRIEKVYKFDELEGELALAINSSKVRDLLAVNVHTSEGAPRLKGSEFFNGANSATQLAIVGTSMMLAMQGPAGKHAKGLGLEVLPALMGSSGQLPMSDAIVQARGRKTFDVLARNIAKMMPHVEAQVLASRRGAVGLMPQGLKIHSPDSVDPQVFQMLSEMFGISRSPFGMKGHGEGVLLPPLPTTTELKMLIRLLEFFGGIRADNRQLQTAMAGRLGEHGAAVETSTILLTTPLGGRYRDDAFETTHHQATGGRLVIYDAGVRDGGLPFDVPAAEGRTDILGRRALEDLDVQKVIGTLATHFQFGGPLEHLFPQFEQRHREILRRYGLDGALHASAWIADHAQAHDTLAFHGVMIDRFAQARLDGLQRVDYGVVREMGLLVTDMAERIRAEQPRLVQVHPDEVKHLMRY